MSDIAPEVIPGLDSSAVAAYNLSPAALLVLLDCSHREILANLKEANWSIIPAEVDLGLTPELTENGEQHSRP